MPHAPTRRGWLALALLGPLAGAAALPGCGFALRQTPPLPFARIALAGFEPRSPLAAELRTRLADSVSVLPTPTQAEVVLHALTDRRERGVVASTAAGQVRELQLRVKFDFRLTTAGGRELIPATELLLSRDMSYSEAAALAKAQEEAELYAAMQADIVQQVLRRLAQVNLAASGGAPARPASAPRS